MLVIRAGIYKMFLRIAHREDPDQTASLIWVCTVCLGLFGRFLFDLILYVPSTIFHLNREGSSWIEPVLS